MTAPAPPPVLHSDRNQLVSLHTMKGVQVYQFTPENQFSLGWGREKNNVSKCTISVPSTLAQGIAPNIVPWVQWISVWDEYGKRLHWTGPIMDWQANRDQLTINASDPAAFFMREVCPITKRWDATDLSYIARELVEAVFEQQGIEVTPVVKSDPRVDNIDYAVTFESESFDQTMANLVQRGLIWSVSMGTPVLGPLSFKPITALSERDFVGESPVIGRDGRDMANNIILRAPKTIARARIPIEGLNLKRIVDVDDMFSVSNAQRAANQYVRHTARARDLLMLPGNTRLHNEAPVSLDQLVPTARFTVEAYGMLSLMELTSMKVECSNGEIEVRVTMVGVDDDPPELAELAAGTNSLSGLGDGS